MGSGLALQHSQNNQKRIIKHQPVLALGLLFLVALELTCALNIPHSSQP